MRLIDLNHLLELVKKNAPFIYSILAPIAMLCPTIEAEPVRHGRWVREDDFAGAIDVPYLCSECSGKVLVSGIWTPKGYGYEYCPMCGAKMDLKGD